MTTPLGATLGFPHVIRSQFKIFVVAKCLNCSHTDTRRPRSSSIPPHLPPLTPSVLRGMRTSALNFAFGTRLNFPHIGHPRHLFLHPLFFVFVFPHHSLTDLFSPSNQKQKKKKNLEEELIFFPSKTNLMEKKKKTTQVFFVFLFYVFIYIYLFFKFKAQCLSVFQSVFTPRFSVRTWRHMSRTVCSYSFTSLLCAL